MKKILKSEAFALLILHCMLTLLSQAQSEEEQLKQLDSYIENTEQVGDYNDLAEQISYNARLNLNTATPFDLLVLPGITPDQVRAIVKHRNEFGGFISVLELQTIDEIPLEKLKILAKLVTVEDNHTDFGNLKRELKMTKKDITYRYATSWPLSKGYETYAIDSSRYFPGSPGRIQLRFIANYKNTVQYGFTAEKDEGEDFFINSNRQGFDYYSAHFFINKKGIVRKIALGDYQAGFGQGLTISSGLGFGKSAYVLNIKRFNSGLRPYRSFNENEFLRGAGINLVYKKLELTTFISSNKIDGTMDSIETPFGLEPIWTSFATDGYHRTALEISKENTITKNLAGQNVSYKGKKLMLGITLIYNSFSKPLQTTDRIYNRYYFTGKEFFKTGIHFDYYIRNINVFGEATTGTRQASGYIAGIYISFGSNVDLVIANRYYSKKFIWYNTNAFSENSNPNNEQGTYGGIVIKLTKKITLSGYIDRYKLPWYSYNADGRSKGIDYLAELNLKPNKTSILYFRVRTKQELTNYNLGEYNGLNWYEKTNIRFHTEFKVLPSITLKTRFEFSKFITPENEIQNGNLLFVDVIYRQLYSPFSFATRMAFFNVDDYNARIYATENDVSFSWPVTGFSGTGTKYYALVKYRYKKNLSAEFRYTWLAYYDKKTIGSGYSTVSSSTLHEINLLISYGFN